MEIPLSKGIRAPIEQIYRGVIKNFFLNESPPDDEAPPLGRLGEQRVLPPCLGEMGAEIRYHLARVEPWLRNGWKVVTRRPAFYPEGTTVEAEGFFAAVDSILLQSNSIGSHGAIHTPPLEHGNIDLERIFDGTNGKIVLTLSDITKVTTQAMAEIALRELFLEWFHFEGRPVSDFDRYNLSFASTAVGNWEYYCGTALRPGFLPPSYVNPPEPVPPHVGVQMRKMDMGLKEEPRNSNPARMMRMAKEAASHLGLEVLVYGHPGGCHIPADAKATWDPARAQGHMARELGYLKSCRLMIAPDSGWADLMAWLMVPTLLEQVYVLSAFEPLRVCFGGKLRAADPRRPVPEQVDELLAAEGYVLPDPPEKLFVDAAAFPWEP